MAEETEGIWLVIGVGLAFLAGLVSLFAFFWLRSISRESGLGAKRGEVTGAERLEYYEKQLVDMRIRLDALEMMGAGQGDAGDAATAGMRPETGAVIPPRLVEGLERMILAQEQAYDASVPADSGKSQDAAVLGEDGTAVASGKPEQSLEDDGKEESTPKPVFSSHQNPIDHVLQLITSGITTSRDIQITMKKSREHTSRLLKKMYEDGYLHRSEDTRPYEYGITAKGTERLGGSAGDGNMPAEPDLQ